MHTLIPLWIIGGPFIALVILAFSFKGPSAMGGSAPRLPPRERYGSERYGSDGYGSTGSSAPVLDPIHPAAPRRIV